MKYPCLDRDVLVALCSRMELKDIPYWDQGDMECLASRLNDLALLISDRYIDLEEDHAVQETNSSR